MRLQWLHLMLLCGSVFLIITVGNAQQLDLHSAPMLREYPFFNSDFIHQMNVKKIHTEVMYKMPNRTLRKTQQRQVFDFDALGNVAKYWTYGSSGSCKSKSYFLNKKGQLSTNHLRFENRNELESFQYNADGFLEKREVSDVRDATVLTQEEFTYEKFSDMQFKRFYLNDKGLTYKYEVVDLDVLQRVVSTRARFIHGVHRSSSDYVYEGDLLMSLASNTREITRREEKYTMEYDTQGVLQVCNFWIDAALIYRYEYLYEDGLLVAVLRKELKTQEIQITKLNYVFYDR